MLAPHTIHPAPGSKHRSKRVGRGNASGHGTTGTRGGKGQTARSGGSHGLARLGFRIAMQQTPKLRGFRSLRQKPAPVTLSDLDRAFDSGATVTLASLREKGLLPLSSSSVKVLNTGVLNKKLVLEGVKTTKGAEIKIKASGGEVRNTNQNH